MTQATEPAISAHSLRKVFGRLVAVDDADLTVYPGDVYGYVGPNGAGKTTSLRMMLGLIRPTSGYVHLFGRDPAREGPAALAGVGGFVEEPTFYPFLSATNNLRLLADLDKTDAPPLLDLLAQVGLAGRADDRVGNYSHGMRQRLGIAAALLRRPRLLLLDEPTTGLDPAGMRDVRALVADLAAGGVTVLLSSHQMGEVEQLCNRLAIIQLGRIRFEGTLEELRARPGTMRYRLRTTDQPRAADLSRTNHGIYELQEEGDALIFTADPAAVASLSVELGQSGVGITELIPQSASLEALFFEVTEGDQKLVSKSPEAAP